VKKKKKRIEPVIFEAGAQHGVKPLYGSEYEGGGVPDPRPDNVGESVRFSIARPKGSLAKLEGGAAVCSPIIDATEKDLRRGTRRDCAAHVIRKEGEANLVSGFKSANK
jgi:hypothetical protein